MYLSSKLKTWLTNCPTWAFSSYCILASFSTYFCMYAFRRPFTVGTFEGITLWGIDYKILLITAQVIGYMISKFIGIRIVSAMPPQKRAWAILLFIGLAELFLLAFALVPAPYNFIFLFLNGLPLGMIWGFVFSYLEGRRTTEALAAGLSASFILSSGIVKSTGKWLMVDFGVSEFWMPFITGAVYLVPLLLSVWMLNQIPPPKAEEVTNKSRREPMTKADRKIMLQKVGGLLSLLIIVYCFLTAFRDFRDNFAANVWLEQGYNSSSYIFSITEIPVALVVLIALGALFKVKDNRKAIFLNHLLIAFGFLLIWLSAFLMHLELVSPIIWFIVSGTGVYLAYVPLSCMFFDRMVAYLRYKGNAGFLIYFADSIGYMGSLLVLLIKNFFADSISATHYLIDLGMYFSLVAIALVIISAVLFSRMKGIQNI